MILGASGFCQKGMYILAGSIKASGDGEDGTLRDPEGLKESCQPCPAKPLTVLWVPSLETSVATVLLYEPRSSHT